MIHPEGYPLNNDLAVLVRALQQESRGTDESAVREILGNIGYLLRSPTARLSSYNALEIETEIDTEQKRLPAVDRDTYRPHAYLRAMGIKLEQRLVPLSFTVLFPFEEERRSYDVQLKMYVTETGKVPGLTVNLGRDIPINLFFYSQEIKRIQIGHAVQKEYARLLVQK